MSKLIREKHHRLPPIAYKGHTAVVFTANIQGRKRLFNEKGIFEVFQKMLLKELESHNCSSYVYVFMPDHLHIIIAGESDGASVKKCMDMFKQRTGFWLYKHKPDIRWQKDYYDHKIRNERDMTAQIRYILQNPVHAGLESSWKKYPYKGSTKYNLDE